MMTTSFVTPKSYLIWKQAAGISILDPLVLFSPYFPAPLLPGSRKAGMDEKVKNIVTFSNIADAPVAVMRAAKMRSRSPPMTTIESSAGVLAALAQAEGPGIIWWRFSPFRYRTEIGSRRSWGVGVQFDHRLFWRAGPLVACAIALSLAGTCLSQRSSPAALIEYGHWKRARAVVEERLRNAPNDPEYLFYLSQIRNAFGDHSTPLPLAEKAVALSPRTAKFHRQLAEVLGVMAQYANPIKQLFLARRFRKEIDTTLALDPNDVQALRDLLEFYLLAPGIAGGDRQQAEIAARRIAKIDSVEGLLAEARIASFEKRTADAHAYLRRAVEDKPERYRARITLAQFDLQPEHTNPGEAEMQAKASLAIEGGRADAYAILAETYAGQSRWSALDALLADAARAVPDDRIAYYRAAERIVATGSELPKAEQYLRMYVAQEPEGNEPALGDAKRELTRIAALERRAPGRSSAPVERNRAMNSKLALIYIDSGGGHRAAATALSEVIQEQQRGWDVEMLCIQDLLDPIDFIRKYTGIPFQEIYNIMLRRGWTVGSAQLIPLMHLVIRMFHQKQVRVLEGHWSRTRPDLVVSMIPHYNRALRISLENVCPGTPFVTLLTDIADYPPHFWIERQEQYVICGSIRAAEQARQIGIPSDRVMQVSGMILNPKFHAQSDPNRWVGRLRLGLQPDLPTGLVLFGGEGSNEMLRIAEALNRPGSGLQLILICGKNKSLASELRATVRRIPMFVEGFTREIPHYMDLSDFFIGKPGPGSISEALSKRLPVIVQQSPWTMAHERYNADWIEDQGVGLVVRNFSTEIRDAVRTLLAPPNYQRFRERASAVRNRAVYEIPDLLEGILANHHPECPVFSAKSAISCEPGQIRQNAVL
jgi:UDP-N-acetylglucosamine:LPS N-acetylglucosamine transferase